MFFFFHEYGRRVGMVPRSSLKEGKNSQMGHGKEKEKTKAKEAGGKELGPLAEVEAWKRKRQRKRPR